MKWNLQQGDPSQCQADLFACFVYEDESPKESCPKLFATATWLEDHPALADFTGKEGEQGLIYAPKDSNLRRVLFIGLGKKKSEKPSELNKTLRRASQKAVEKARALKAESLTIALQPLFRLPLEAENILTELAYSAKLASHSFIDFFGKKAQEEKSKDLVFPSEVSFLLDKTSKDLQTSLDKALIKAKAVNFCRDLVNSPSNAINPAELAKKAQALQSPALSCKILDAKELQKQGFGAHFAVGQGSDNPPCLICLEYAPKGTKKDKPLVFVGKGITFDSGGISIKPSAGMHEMKSDMGGAGALLSVFSALADLDAKGLAPKRRVVALLACAENMPSGAAFRPGDIVTSYSGKTIEVINTDAEGRLVLCDALSYAQKQWQPEALIDLATLTGACVVALGNERAGLFSDDYALVSAIRHIGAKLGDFCWPLPLDDRFFADHLKSSVADMTNCGPREGSSISAAVFLKQFIEKETRWVHIDIAGPSYSAKKTADWPAGGTGFGVRTVLELIEQGVPEVKNH